MTLLGCATTSLGEMNMFNPDTEIKHLQVSLRRRKGEKYQVLEPALNILLWQEEEKYFAHCLELDIVAEGDSEKNAVAGLADLIISQIEFSEKKSMEFFHPAPAEYWKKLHEIHMNRVRQSLLENPPKSPKEFLKGLEPINV